MSAENTVLRDFCLLFPLRFSETGDGPVAQAGLKPVAILLPQPPEGWNYRREPPHLLETRTIFPTISNHFCKSRGRVCLAYEAYRKEPKSGR